MLGIISVHQVLLNASRFEELDRSAILQCIGQGSDAAIEVDAKKPRFFVLDGR